MASPDAARARRLVSLPEREVARIALAAGIRILGRVHLSQPLPAEPAVLGKRLHIEVDVARAVQRLVGMPPSEQGTQQLDHLGYVTRCPRFVGRVKAAENGVRPGEATLVEVGVRPPGTASSANVAEYLVVDIGDVADVRDVVARAAGTIA